MYCNTNTIIAYLTQKVKSQNKFLRVEKPKHRVKPKAKKERGNNERGNKEEDNADAQRYDEIHCKVSDY